MKKTKATNKSAKSTATATATATKNTTKAKIQKETYSHGHRKISQRLTSMRVGQKSSFTLTIGSPKEIISLRSAILSTAKRVFGEKKVVSTSLKGDRIYVVRNK